MLQPIIPDCAAPPPPCNVHPYQIQACDTVAWNFGDGTTATMIGNGFIQHTYAAGGSYRATATITNSLGTAPVVSFNPIVVGLNPPVYVELTNANLTVPENAGAMTFNLVRSGDLSNATTVHYVQPPPGAPASTRVETVAADITFSPGETAKSFSLQVHDDHVYSGNLNGAVLLTSSDGTLFRSNGQTGSSAGAGFTIAEDDPQPTASIADARALEGIAAQKYAELVVTMSAPMGVPVQFLGFVEDGTAKAGADYVRGSTTCIIDAGQTSCALHVLIVDDDVPEPDETFTLTAEQRVGEPGPAFTRRTAAFTIVNDDAALTPSTSRVAAGAEVALRLDVGQPQPLPLTVFLQSLSPEVVDVPPSVTIPAGQSSASFTAHAAAAGRSRVTAAVPGMTAPPALVTVVDAVTIVAQPAALALRPGSDGAVAVSLHPPRGGLQFLTATSTRSDVATVPDTLTIPAGGTAALPVHAVANGVATIAISTPDGFTLAIDVVVSNDPTVARIEPASAPATGGAVVTLVGEGLDARCTVAFDATPATSVSAAANGLAVVVPAHAPGSADVSVVCGASKLSLPNAFTFFVQRRRAAG
jgi:PKD repeat protein